METCRVRSGNRPTEGWLPGYVSRNLYRWFLLCGSYETSDEGDGNGLYLSGSTFNIGYNSRYSVDFYEGSNSNHYAFCPTLANNAGDTYRLYLGGNGGDTHPWYKVVTRDGMQQLSDGRFKIDKCILNDDFYDMYMSLKPTKYKVLHDEDSGIHFGFVALGKSKVYVGMIFVDGSPIKVDGNYSFFWRQKPNEIISKKISVNSAKSNVVFAYMYEQGGDVDSSYVTDKYKIQP